MPPTTVAPPAPAAAPPPYPNQPAIVPRNPLNEPLVDTEDVPSCIALIAPPSVGPLWPNMLLSSGWMTASFRKASSTCCATWVIVLPQSTT